VIYFVTGLSGFLGRALAQSLLADPTTTRLIGLTRDEHKITALERQFADPRLEVWLGDLRDKDRLMWAFRVKPDIVIHGAALKTIEQCEKNQAETTKTNVDGTRNVVEAAMLADVGKVMVVSSDKAAEPITAYGKSKAMAEAIAIGQNRYRGSGATCISVVRYGNVEASSGSVVPMFQDKGRRGEPVPITHPDMTRFWWRVSDAVAFVRSSLEMMRGCEIFVPKIGSHRISDLARAHAPLSSQEIIGVRNVEKLHELMVSDGESVFTWELPDRYVLLPAHGQSWSPPPPTGAVLVQPGFRFSSDKCVVPVLPVGEVSAAS
jgi:UDP-N-acetylglucosamine 4,6-dehydratase